MSLTTELRDRASPVTRFFMEHFPNIRPIQKAWRRKVAGSKTLHPHFPTKGRRYERPPYNTIGTALDYRLRYYFSARSPLFAAAWGALLYEHGRMIEDPPVVPAPMLISAFFVSLDKKLSRLQPVRRRLKRPQEVQLCRYCYVLALFEELYRAGWEIDSPLYYLDSTATVDDLLSVAAPAWVDDLCNLSWTFYDRFRPLLSQRAVLNPGFEGAGDVGGADADIIVGSCLVDIKTTVKPDWLDRAWIYQLLGYVLLDYHNQYGIESVGIYLSRQGGLIRWPLAELATMLTGAPRLSFFRLRREFREVLKTLRQRRLASIASRLGIPRSG